MVNYKDMYSMHAEVCANQSMLLYVVCVVCFPDAWLPLVFDRLPGQRHEGTGTLCLHFIQAITFFIVKVRTFITERHTVHFSLMHAGTHTPL